MMDNIKSIDESKYYMERVNRAKQLYLKTWSSIIDIDIITTPKNVHQNATPSILDLLEPPTA